MLTNATTADPFRSAGSVDHDGASTTAAQQVVIVNGTPEMIDLIEMVLDTGRYDVVFVESSQHAYSQIKRVQPNLVILCMRIDDAEGFQVLSMLKLDRETRGIPVLTYTPECAGQVSQDDDANFAEAEMFASKPAVWMN